MYPKGGAPNFPPYYPSSYKYQAPNFPPYYPSSYKYQNYQQPYLANKMVKNETQNDYSKLAFNIKISLELYPGDNISKETLNVLKCNSRWEDVRKSWSEFTGKPYVIKPNYQNINNTNNRTQNMIKKGGSKRKTRKHK